MIQSDSTQRLEASNLSALLVHSPWGLLHLIPSAPDEMRMKGTATRHPRRLAGQDKELTTYLEQYFLEGEEVEGV